MNIQFGFGFGYAMLPGASVATQPGTATQSAGATSGQPSGGTATAGAGPTADGGHVMSMAPPSQGYAMATAPPSQGYAMGYLSPAYLMMAPQMMVAQPGYAGPGYPMSPATLPPATGASVSPAPASEASAPSASGGHVVSNTTNALASSGPGYLTGGGAMAAPAGGYGMLPMMAMTQPVLLSPVLLQFGIPLMFAYGTGAPQGSAGGAQQAPPAAAPPAADAPAEDAVAGSAGAVQTVSAESGQTDAESASDTGSEGFSVASLNAEDYQKFRLKHLEASLETTLSLSLRTAEGDEVSLSFSQLDAIEQTRFAGRSLEGDRVRHSSHSETSDRVVNMMVNGDLSDTEKAAIDALLSQVIDVANRFFGGSLGGAMDRLKSMDFDTGAVAEFSLKMSMQRSVAASRSYQGAEHPLKRLAERDGEIMKALEFFANEQRTLIESASEVLDDPSSVRLVQSLLPPLLGEPVQALLSRIGDHVAEPPVVEPHEADVDDFEPADFADSEEDDALPA